MTVGKVLALATIALALAVLALQVWPYVLGWWYGGTVSLTD